jgi:hypothetical protein
MINKIVAIDYDDTYTLSPNMWKEAITLFRHYGFEVYIVTYRHSTQFSDMDRDIKGIKDVIFTNGNSKQKYCENIGINVDIWIDDSPESIVFDYIELLARF